MAEELVRPLPIKPMLAQGASVPTENPADMLWEIKYDGLRVLEFNRPGNLYLQARSGTNKTNTFPELQIETHKECILDSEVISATGLSFQDSVQHRMNRKRNIEEAVEKWPMMARVFDIISIDGENIEHLPLLERKGLLDDMLIQTDTVRLAAFTSNAIGLWDQVIVAGHEGMVGKRTDMPYRRDKRDWLKVKAWKRNYGKKSTGETFMIVGYTAGTGWRKSSFGSLILARFEKDTSLTYIGSVGTGMESTGTSEMTIEHISSYFKPDDCPWPKEPESAIWIKPIPIYLQYLEYTNAGMVRFPSFKGLM